MKPLALLGCAEQQIPLQRLCEEAHLGIIPLATPHHNPKEALASLGHLGYAGALIADSLGAEFLPLASRSSVEAKRIGKIDSYSAFNGYGTFTLEEALLGWVERSGNHMGRKLALVGDSPELKACAQLARLGFSAVSIISNHPTTAEDIAKHIPQGMEYHTFLVSDYGFQATFHQQDLIIATDSVGTLPFYPYQELIDLNYSYLSQYEELSVWSNKELAAERLSLQLEWVSGRKVAPSLVMWAFEQT